jgi:hypothetical protein
MEGLRFPAWQPIYIAAVSETNPKNLRDRVKAAEKAVSLRARQIEDSNEQNDEKLAICGALKRLRCLRGLAEWV